MARLRGDRASLRLVLLGGLVVGATITVANHQLHDWTYLGATIQMGATLAVCRRLTRHDWRMLPGLLAIALLSVFGVLLDARIADDTVLHIVPELCFLLALFILGAGLLVIASRRLGSDFLTVLADSVIVAVGAWMLFWWWVLQPTSSRSDGPWWVTTMHGTTLTASAVVLFAFATSVIGDAWRTPSVWLMERAPATRRQPMTTGILVTLVTLTVPVVALASNDPLSSFDRAVRSVSMLVLAAAVAARMALTVRANSSLQRELEQRAAIDSLTGLPNRALVAERLELAITRGASPSRTTVLFIDIDRFKNINDSLGHQAGDDVLVAVARRLQRVLPVGCTVGRISGDEFAVIDERSPTSNSAMTLAEHVVGCFQEPLSLRLGDIFVTTSIGVAVGDGGSPAEGLLRQAETAMYRAKQSGRNCIAVFDASMFERASQRLAIETALHRALGRREIRLVHQPIVDLTHGTVNGFEALMRWEREDGTGISPAEFIPIAEETGTIIPLGAWAILEALSHLRDWIDRGSCAPDATMSVNVSPRQLHDPAFVHSVEEALRRTGISPSQLWLEVTESVMLAEPEPAIASLRRLSQSGVRIAVDDFGTGYSSLSLLRRFPVHRLKIDRSFVNELPHDASATTLVRTIVAMCRSLDLDSVAEGVETKGQLDALTSMGCASAQGYLLSHPLPAVNVPATLASLTSRMDVLRSRP